MKRTILGLGALIAMTGCEKLDLFEHDYKTPASVRMIHNGYDPNIEVIDSKYLDVRQCLMEFGRMPHECYTQLEQNGSLSAECKSQHEYLEDYVWDWKFVTSIVSEAGEPFTCEGSPTGRCAGEYDPTTKGIRVDENGLAFAHELVHRYAGDFNHTGPTRYCGDFIDGFYNSQEMDEQQRESLLFDIVLE